MDYHAATQLEVSWGRTLRIWWSYMWRCSVFSALLGLVLGFLGGFAVALIGRPDLGGTVGGLLGYLGTIPISIVMLKKILQKKFREFSIRLIPNVVE